tara:strand:+ start:2685 stop:4031 length:1347 start_codon:yes stop_codon:yes gene_type:complete
MKKSIYIFLVLILFATTFIVFKIVSDDYDKQNQFILKIKEIVPTEIKNRLRGTVLNLRANIKKDENEQIQLAKKSQGLSGNLIQSEIIQSEIESKKFFVREFFLPFERLDLSYGWRAIENSKRAHYLDIIDDKTVAVSGDGQFIFFETENFTTQKLDQKKIDSNLEEILEKENFKLIGLRDLLIDEDKLYISAILQDRNENYTISIMSAKFNLNKLEFEFFFNTEMKLKKYSIGTGGRIVKFKDNKLLLTIGHFSVPEKVQDLNHLAGKIISINKFDKKHELISLGHRNQQGLFYYQDESGNQFILNSEHGPKGGDEINVNYLESEKLYNFGWPIASYGINYDGTNPFKSSHKDFGFDEPLKYFTPSIGISEISIINNNEDSNTIYTSSLRAHSIYLIKTNKKFTKVFNTDRLKFDYRIRDLKYVDSLDGHILIFENIPSIGFIKIKN